MDKKLINSVLNKIKRISYCDDSIKEMKESIQKDNITEDDYVDIRNGDWVFKGFTKANDLEEEQKIWHDHSWLKIKDWKSWPKEIVGN